MTDWPKETQKMVVTLFWGYTWNGMSIVPLFCVCYYAFNTTVPGIVREQSNSVTTPVCLRQMSRTVNFFILKRQVSAAAMSVCR